jgi:hypothetical protein
MSFKNIKTTRMSGAATPPSSDSTPSAVQEERPPVEESRKEPVATLPVITVKELPSKWIPYPKGAEIKYVPYLFGELWGRSQSIQSPKDSYKLILDGITTSFNKEELTYFDFIFISLLRRLSTFGTDQITLEFVCPVCGHRNKEIILLGNLEFKDVEAPEFPVCFSDPEDGTEFEVSPLTMGKYFMLLDMGKEKDRVAVYAACVRNLEFPEAYRRIFYAKGELSETLEYVDELLYFGVKPLTLRCKGTRKAEGEDKPVKCDVPIKVEIDDEKVIIEPFRGNVGSIRDRVQFGPAKHS